MHSVKRVAIATALLLVAVNTPASAHTVVGAYTTESGVGAEAQNQGMTAAHSSTQSNGTPPCTFQTIANTPDAVYANGQGGTSPIYDSTHPSTAGSWLWQQCTNSSGTITSLNTVWVPNANPTAIAQQAIADQALPVPAVSVNPPLPDGAIVNFPTWLWVDPAAWRPVSATAAINGLRVTATASPQAIVWNMGDSHSVTCNGPGTPYNDSIPATEQNSDCTYTFNRSSASEPGRVFSVTATIQWAATWRASDGTSGSLGTITRSTTLSLPVREIQAINITPTGSR